MNSLESWLACTGTDETQTMNTLQDKGLISDNCVHAKDVAETDAKRAIEFLNGL